MFNNYTRFDIRYRTYRIKSIANRVIFIFLLLISIFGLIYSSDFTISKQISEKFHHLLIPHKNQTFINSISVSYIVSVIFYLVVVYFPENNKRFQAKMILENKIITIIFKIEVFIKYVIKANSIIENRKISPKTFENIKPFSMDKMKFSYEKEFSNGKKERYSLQNQLELIFIANSIEIILKMIDEINKHPICNQLDYDIQLFLSEIKENRIINYYNEKTLEATKQMQKQMIYTNQNEGIYDLWRISQKLSLKNDSYKINVL